MFNYERQLWLQQMVEGPISIVQPYNDYKMSMELVSTQGTEMLITKHTFMMLL